MKLLKKINVTQKVAVFSLSFCALASLQQAGAVVIASHSPETNDRFANDGSFIGAAYDFTGVGRVTTGEGQWATRIGSNYFLSASHFHPGTGESVIFYNSNNSSGTSFTYTVAGGQQIAGTDIWLGYFDTNIDSSIATYGYSTTAANNVSEAGLSGLTLFATGNSITADGTYGGGAFRTTDMAVGQNQAESWWEEGTTTINIAGVNNTFASAAGWDQIVTIQNQSGDDANIYQTFETMLQDKDSGSPLFSVRSGVLQLEGLAWAIVTEGGGLYGNFVDTGAPGNIDADTPADPLERRPASLYTYIGSYQSDIAAALNINAIPEPSGAIIGFLSFLILSMRRKRA